MLAHHLLCFFVTVVIDTKTAAGKFPAFLKPGNYSDELAFVSPHINPCKNFYAYSCNSWITHVKKPPYEPIWNPWIEVNHKIKQRLSNILTRHDPLLVKPQIFHRSCMRIIDHETKYLQELKSLVENLGGWPLTDKNWNDANYQWFHQLAKITKTLGIHPILKIHADLDYLDPKQFVIYVEPGDLIFPQYILTGKNHLAELEAYEKWILDTATHMYDDMADRIFPSEVKEIIKFEMHLAKIMDLKQWHERTTVKKVLKKFSVDWMGVLNGIFGDFTEIQYNTTLAIKNYAYLKNVLFLISTTKQKTVANYIMWSVIKDLSRDTTHHMRELNFLIDHAILGVTGDISRDYECLDKAIKYFGSLLVPPYLKSFVSPQVFSKVTSMVNSIKTEFVNILHNNHWLSKEAKIATAEKINNIELYLGYPSEIFNGTPAEHYHHTVQMTSDHFMNIIKLKSFQQKHLLSQISEKTNPVVWPSSPFDVNAYYSVLQNAIFVPLGLLQPPFFHPNRETIFNFGALGVLIGHEISHSLDPTGILADATGKIAKWLPEQDLAAYRKHIHCFGDDATILGENIADSSGLKISLEVIKNKKVNHKLKYFFISFAQMWCETSANMEMFTGDEHATNANRVKNLINNKDFQEVFACDSSKSCELW
ncbi:neprilysin-1-like [Zophobas morio]|uniref:neprilysin-1-like n=1 Tax=Zophobas morio TaxID=2755281 RepID=UPI0030831A3B